MAESLFPGHLLLRGKSWSCLLRFELRAAIVDGIFFKGDGIFCAVLASLRIQRDCGGGNVLSDIAHNMTSEANAWMVTWDLVVKGVPVVELEFSGECARCPLLTGGRVDF